MKISGIAALYMQSFAWQQLSVNSKKTYMQAMKHMDSIMNVEANKLTRPMIIALMDRLYEKRAICRNAMAVLNNILNYGYDRGLCDFNHAKTVRGQPKSKPMKKWSQEECDLFLKDAPFRFRLAFCLALYTGQRRGDLAKMEWQQVEDDTIVVRQEKTGRFLRIPLHPVLKDVLKEARKLRRNDPYILHNAHGQPLTPIAMTVMIRDRAHSLGIMDRSVHGLRKTAGSTLAEAGCSPHHIAAILGHKTLKEIQLYTEEADQLHLAKEAIKKWEAHSSLSA